MKKIFAGVLTIVMMSAVVLPSAVIAQEDSTSSSEAETSQSTVDSAGSLSERATNRAAARDARIADYKQRVTDRLSATEERRIVAACKAAQVVVAKLQSNLSTAIERRKDAYANVSEKLAEVVRKLKVASVDTTELEDAVTEMERQAAAVIVAAEEYSATLTDLTEMDCEADPSGFKAALVVAREQRAAVVSQAQSLKEYVKVNIKAILQKIREQLANDAATEGA